MVALYRKIEQEKFRNVYPPPCYYKTRTNLPFIEGSKTSIKGIICYAFTSTTSSVALEKYHGYEYNGRDMALFDRTIGSIKGRSETREAMLV